MSYTSTTWSSWAGDSTAGSATSFYTTTATWTGWVSDTATYSTSTTTTIDSNMVWYEWCGDGSLRQINTPQSGAHHDHAYRPKVESAEETIARLEREKADAERARVEAEERSRAAAERERKAYAFLLLCLDEKQKKDLEEKKHFELSVIGGRRYRIKTGQSRNIQELDQSGQVKRTLCFHPKDNLHHYDAMAIQKLALECDEERALKVANFS